MTQLVTTTPNGQAAATYDAEMAAHLTSLYNADGTPVGMEDVMGERLALPRLSIVQQQAQAKELGVQQGQLYHSALQEAGDSFDVYIIGIVKGRIWMPDYDPKASDVEPLCRSTNFTSPDPKFVRDGKAPAAACATCPKAVWDRQRDLPPDCTEQFQVYGTFPDGMPFVFACRKTAVKAIKAFMQPFVYSKKPMFLTRSRITTKAVENYFVPVIQQLRDQPTDPATAAGLAEIAAGFRARLLEVHDDEAPEQEQAQATAPAQQPVQHQLAPVVQPAPVHQPAPVAQAAPVQQPAAPPPTQPQVAPVAPPAQLPASAVDPGDPF